MYAQQTRHIIERKPTTNILRMRFGGGESREERKYTATAAIQFTD